MFTYSAAYCISDDGVCAELVDFPHVFARGDTLNEARLNLVEALVQSAVSLRSRRELLPRPNSANDADSDAQIEPIDPFPAMVEHFYPFQIDVDQIKRNLQMTPTQRLERNERALAALEGIFSIASIAVS